MLSTDFGFPAGRFSTCCPNRVRGPAGRFRTVQTLVYEADGRCSTRLSICVEALARRLNVVRALALEGDPCLNMETI